MKRIRPEAIVLCDYALSWLFAVVFLHSAFPHWGNPYYFLGSIYSYKIVSSEIGQIVAIILPVIELGLAFCFLTRTILNAAHLATFGLFVGFATVQTTAYFRGLDISCGCFGPGHESTIGLMTLLKIYSLLICSLLRNGVIFFSRGSKMVAHLPK